MNKKKITAIEQKFLLAEAGDTTPEIFESLANEKNIQLCDEAIRRNFYGEYPLRQAIANNSHCPVDILERLVTDTDAEVRIAAAGNTSLTPRMIVLLSNDAVESVQMSLAENPICPINILKKWAQNNDENWQSSIAINPACPQEILKELAQSKSINVRISLARNPSCPSEILDAFAKSKNVDIRASVAGNQSSPPKLIVKLSKDRHPFVRENVAMNPLCPIDILSILASDADSEVRLAVAENSATTKEVAKNAKEVPTTYFPNNSCLPEINKEISKIINCIKDAIDSFPGNSWITEEKNCSFLDSEYMSPCWKLKILKLPASYVDRCRSMLAGPFFVSTKYPWPTRKDGAFATPITQIDLSEISRLRGQDYGDGLLQVFVLGLSDSFIRVIPRSDIKKRALLPMPVCDESNVMDFTSAPDVWWQQNGQISQIIGYEEPVLSASVSVNNKLNKDSPESIKDLSKSLSRLNMNHSGFHMFGTFLPIQYSHKEVGKELFMALDSDYGYIWGDAGNAQIFCERDEGGKIEFSFDWSCY